MRRRAPRPSASPRLLVGALLALSGGGCTEVARPAPAPAPADLAAGAPDAARAAIGAAAAAFADRGAGLANRPDAAAQAAAQLEYAAEAFATDPRWTAMPEGVRREMLLARDELRDAIGLDAAAPSRTAVSALLGAARALRAGDRGRAAAALPSPLFRPGGEGSIARLGDTGPLPQAANATALAQAVASRMEVEGRLGSTQMRERSMGIGGVGLARDPAGY
ncbi:hypothetical protein [Craurococcus roseus]|uniref:hypothetical protein n=1 Tax=Craurococcus roseus TaxID=77585 RepID=UPI0031D2D83E